MNKSDIRTSQIPESGFIKHYLSHRRKYEVLAVIATLLLFAATNTTTEILDSVKEGKAVDWAGAWALELSSVLSVLILWPLALAFITRLNLSLANLRWRVFWHAPGFLLFSLLHIGLFVVFRKLLWTLSSEVYRFGDLWLNLMYEMRKDFLVYIGIMFCLYSYRFIITRLQGEAKFLADSVDDENKTQQQAGKTQFLVKMLDKEYLLKVEDICWISSASNYVLMNCGDRSYPMRQTLTGLAKQLDPTKFMRVHRTAIVNIDHVSSLLERGDLQLRLISGETVAVSKTYLPELKQLLAANSS